MTLCTNCAEAVPYLYTVYHSVDNVRLEQCPSCRAPADPYVEHDPLVIALDLILLKRGVYRHLLFNRCTPPRKVDQTPHGHVDSDGQRSQKEQHHRSTEEEKKAQEYARETSRRWLIVRIGAGVILVDSFVRWSRVRRTDIGLPLAPAPASGSSSSSWPKSMSDGEAAVAFLRILLGCFVETTSFHGGITLASFLVLTSLDRIARWRKRAISPPSTIRQQLRYSHIPLCLLYSSLTKFMLLVVLAIWGPHVRKDSDTSPPAYVYKIPFEGPLWHLLDDNVLDRTWLVRNLLGGLSAGFGLRMVLDCHPFFTSLVILSGCLIKTVIVSIVREFVGPGNGVEETWLAYSIP